MTGNFKIALFAVAIVSAFILISSCKKSVKSKSQLVEYVSNPKNKLHIIHNAGKVETSLTFKPWQLMMNRYQPKSRIDTTLVKSLKSKYFFVLSLSANHKEILRQLKFSDYSEMVQVMAFRMSEYVSAVFDGGEAVVPDECLFQQTYGMSTANQLLIVFDRSKFKGAKTIEVRIKEFGLHLGNLNYPFKMQDIIDLQNIKIEQ